MVELSDRDLVTSEFASVLHGRKIKLIDRPERGAPIPAWARLHAKLARAFRYANSALDNLIAKREEENWGQQGTGLHQEAVDSLEDVIYAAAEVFSFYEADIPYYFDLDADKRRKNLKATYVKHIKEQKRFSSLTSNACKHNHNFMFPVEVIYPDGSVSIGFAIYSRSGNVFAINKEISPDGGAFSFRRTLINILARVILADHHAANLVRALPDEPTAAAIDCSLHKLPYLHAIRSISSLSDIGMPGEQPSFEFEKSEIDLIRINRDMDPQNYEGKHGSASLSILMLVLGNDLHFEFPITGKDLHLKIEPEDGNPSPIAGEMRLDLRDHPIPAKE